MRPDLWIAFVLATLVIGLVPGPGVAAILGYAIGSGRRTAFASVAGLVVGNGIAAIASLAGVGALLATSALLFGLLKWAGAAYLVTIGAIGLWRARDAQAVAIRPRMIAPRAAFLGNLGVGAFHPKTILFLAAFTPQFLDPARPYVAQVLVLVPTFVLTLGLTDSAYAWAASSGRLAPIAPRSGLGPAGGRRGLGLRRCGNRRDPTLIQELRLHLVQDVDLGRAIASQSPKKFGALREQFCRSTRMR